MDRITKEQRSGIMKSIKSKDTKPEKLMLDMLAKFGLDFVLNDPSLPGKPDAVLMEAKVAVFMHGCFWHCHAGCFKMPKSRQEFWVPKLERNVARDKEAAEALKSLGYKVIVIWECMLKPGKMAAVQESLARALGVENPERQNVIFL